MNNLLLYVSFLSLTKILKENSKLFIFFLFILFFLKGMCIRVCLHELMCTMCMWVSKEARGHQVPWE